MMDIYFVIHEYSGASTYAKELLHCLKKRADIRFHLVYFGTSRYKQFTVGEKDGMFIFYIPILNKNNLQLYSRRVVDLLSPWVEGKECTILHINNPNQRYLGQYFKEKFNSRIVYTLHFLTNEFTMAHLDHSSVEQEDKTGNKETMCLVDKVIGVTRFATDVLSTYYQKERKNVHLIYNGYSDSLAVQQVDLCTKMRLKEQFGFNKDDLLLVYAGRIDEAKGCDKLLLAMERLQQEYGHIHLIVAGDGNYKASLGMVGLNCAKIHFTGYLSEDKLLQLYQIADIGIVPSLWEQCSYVALEMMAHGIPIIYSDVPGISELFDRDETGLPISCQRDSSIWGLSVDAREISDAVAKLVTSKERREVVGRRARLKWQKEYTAEVMEQKTYILYNSL